MTANTPFIKLFCSPIGKYFYDVGKNKIMRIDKNVYEYLQCLIQEDEQFADNETMNMIDSLKAQGYLSVKRPTIIQHTYTDYLQLFLERKIEKITLQVTQQCNFRCKYCIYSEDTNLKQRAHSPRKMTLQMAKKAIDFLWEHSVDSSKVNIGFYGGEPLLEFELLKQLVEYAETIFEGKSISFTTTVNGSLLADQIVEYFIEHDISLMISLDGPKEIHDMNRVFIDGSGTYDTVTRNIKHINEKYPEYAKQIQISMVMDPTNDFDCINSIIIDNECIDFSNLNAAIVDKTDEPVVFSENFVQHSEYQYFLALLSHLNGFSANRVSPISNQRVVGITSEIENMLQQDSIPDTIAPGGPCIPGQLRLFINVNGDFFPCERVNETDVMKIGNLDAGFNYDRAKEILNIGSLTPEECRNCWAMRNCNICAKLADDGEKLSPKFKINHCSQSKNSFLGKLRAITLLREMPVYHK